jgi:hypothetical protein
MVINGDVNVRVCDINYTGFLSSLSGKCEETSTWFMFPKPTFDIGTSIIRIRTSLSVPIVYVIIFLPLLY